jgi:putative ABC transport system permease protein
MASSVRSRRPGLLLEVGRNLRRRKLRSFLTLSGIALGAFALTVMGALSENFNSSIGSLQEFLEEQVLVRSKGSEAFFAAGHVPISLVGELEKIDNVEVAVPALEVNIFEESSGGFGPPKIISGVDIKRALRSPLEQFDLLSGRRLEAGDRWKIVLGSTLAKDIGDANKLGRPIRSGEKATLRGHEFEVVGVQQATGTPIDLFSVASIEDARVIAKEDDEFLPADKIAGEIRVYPKPGIDPNDLADEVEAAVGNRVKVFPPQESSEQLEAQTAIFSVVILGSALVAILVGGVAIINTMIFSVTERVREIGIKKAIGASARNILREFFSEAVILSFAGGLLGLFSGYAFTKLLNLFTRDTGVIAFTVTPRLAIFVFLLSMAIGAVSGILPARRAARIDPVRALRTLG